MSAILSLMRSITYNYFQADRQLLGYWLQPTGLICTLYYLYVLYLLQVWKINIHTYISHTALQKLTVAAVSLVSRCSSLCVRVETSR